MRKRRAQKGGPLSAHVPPMPPQIRAVPRPPLPQPAPPPPPRVETRAELAERLTGAVRATRAAYQPPEETWTEYYFPPPADGWVWLVTDYHEGDPIPAGATMIPGPVVVRDA
jgi:hypothetical protein